MCCACKHIHDHVRGMQERWKERSNSFLEPEVYYTNIMYKTLSLSLVSNFHIP